ncbi:MAG: hypothetical protein ABI772_10090 [Bacteroidota bacterium]
MPGQLKISITGEAGWNELFTSSRSRVPFMSSVYVNAISKAFGYSNDYVVVESDGKAIAGLCVYFQKKAGVKFNVHPALTPYNAVVYSGSLNSDDLLPVNKMLAEFVRTHYVYPYFLLDTLAENTNAFTQDGWNVLSGKTYLMNPAKDTPDADIRRRARKCEAEGFYISNEYNASWFWQLYSGTMLRQAINLHITQQKMIELIDAVAPVCKMYSSFDKENKLHACWIQAGCDNNIIYNWNAASDIELLSKGGTPFLVTHIIKDLNDRKISTWDLCGADHPSVARFKGSIGGQLATYSKINYSSYSLLKKVQYRLLRFF